MQSTSNRNRTRSSNFQERSNFSHIAYIYVTGKFSKQRPKTKNFRDCVCVSIWDLNCAHYLAVAVVF